MKIKEYIAEKIIKFVFNNSTLDELGERVDDLYRRLELVTNKISDMEETDCLSADIAQLKEAYASLENRMNHKHVVLTRAIDKLQPEPSVTYTNTPDGSETMTLDQPISSKDYRSNFRKSRRR